MKTEYIRTPDSQRLLVDANLKVEKVFYVPSGETPDLNGGDDLPGAIFVGTDPENKRLYFKAAEGEWIACANLSNEPLVIVDADAGETFELPWDGSLGNYGNFAVWMLGDDDIYHLEDVPISFEQDGDGKPTSYIFTLNNIKSLIFLI